MNKHEHTNCQSLLTSISEYVDGSLNPDLCEELERHIADCQDCHIVVDTMRKTISLYRQSSADCASLPEVIRERLYRTLNLEDYLS